VDECIFCRIARRQADAVVLYDDAEIMAFLDIAPIRPGHTHIIPKQHFETFEVLPSDLAGRILVLGQVIARKMKAVYRVNRVAFVFTGGDVAHAHAHVVPMLEKTDITSARYIVNPQELQFASKHLDVDRQALLDARRNLGMEA
jgi:histidine triad (HIT) family protein